MSRDHNHDNHQQRLLEEARKAWQESEWVLNILRTQTAARIKRATDQEVLEWYTKRKR